MYIKKIKKVSKLKKNDVILIGIADQQDAGVYSDVTNSNVIAIVDSVTIGGDEATVLVNGGYEYIFNKKEEVFYIGDFTVTSAYADLIVQTFGDSNTPRKEINAFLESVNVSLLDEMSQIVTKHDCQE